MRFVKLRNLYRTNFVINDIIRCRYEPVYITLDTVSLRTNVTIYMSQNTHALRDIYKKIKINQS